MCINVILLDTKGQVISHLFFSSQTLYSRKCAYSRGTIFAGEDYEFAVAIRGKRVLSVLFLDQSLTVRFHYIYCLICFWGWLGKTHPLITLIIAKRESLAQLKNDFDW